MKNNDCPIGCWKVTTASGEVYFADRYEEDTVADAEAAAFATFGVGVTVEAE